MKVSTKAHGHQQAQSPHQVPHLVRILIQDLEPSELKSLLYKLCGSGVLLNRQNSHELATSCFRKQQPGEGVSL